MRCIICLVFILGGLGGCGKSGSDAGDDVIGGAKRTATWPEALKRKKKKAPSDSATGAPLAPAGTPKDVIARLNLEIGRALAAPDVRSVMTGAGIDIGGGSAQFFTDFMRSEMARWQKVAQTAGIKPE